eukprot:918914_1
MRFIRRIPLLTSPSSKRMCSIGGVRPVGVGNPLQPFKVRGKVVKGFQRGREIGVRTANLDPTAFHSYKLLDEADNGVYVGFASVSRGEVHKAVLSIGYNPFFKNAKKTLEAHILHEFDNDFYDEEISLVICGYIRKMTDFDSLDALMKAINKDIVIGRSVLDEDHFLCFQTDDFFLEDISK